MLERREGSDWISSQANWNQDHAPSCDMMERPNGQDNNNNKNITIINNSWPNRKKKKKLKGQLKMNLDLPDMSQNTEKKYIFKKETEG